MSSKCGPAFRQAIMPRITHSVPFVASKWNARLTEPSLILISGALVAATPYGMFPVSHWLYKTVPTVLPIAPTTRRIRDLL